MHLLICSKLSFPTLNRYLPDWNLLPSFECTYDLNRTMFRPGAILVMGIGAMAEALEAIRKWPDVAVYVYHWDCYSWVWHNPRKGEYDYATYADLLRRAREIWVPSECTAVQAKQWWNGLPSIHTIKPSCPYWASRNVRDDGYVLCTLRMIPDVNVEWFEDACNELNIPYRLPNHNLPYAEYQNLVEGCRLMVSHYYEASTGGLSLLEGYHLGKPVLISDSIWNGAGEYFGNRAEYFCHFDFAGFRATLGQFYEEPPVVQSDHRDWVEVNFNDVRMIREILERIHENTGAADRASCLVR